MMWGYDGFGFGGGMGIGMLLFWVVLIAAIVLVVRGTWGGSGPDAPRTREKGAIDILRERYARGEIDRREFEEKRRDLEASSPTTSVDKPDAGT